MNNWIFSALALLALVNPVNLSQTVPNNKPLVLIHIPRKQALLVQQHLRNIVAKGWAEITPGDLYHGHILLSPTSHNIGDYSSLEELFSHMVMIEYHSDEIPVRWRITDGDLPTDKKRPRSIIGFLDGSVAPAASLMGTNLSMLKNYEWNGSITPNELAEALPNTIEKRQYSFVHTAQGSCYVNLQIDIGLGHPPEPVISVGKDNLKVTMDCMDPKYN